MNAGYSLKIDAFHVFEQVPRLSIYHPYKIQSRALSHITATDAKHIFNWLNDENLRIICKHSLRFESFRQRLAI